MPDPHDIHSRRLGDLITYVQTIVDEVNDYLQSGQDDPKQKQILTKKQASAISALQQAMDMQKELMGQLDRGEALPSRRATDPTRGKPNLATVEALELDTIRRLAGIES
jgi:hypothetical protein